MSAAGWFYVQDDKRRGPVAVEDIVHLVVTAALPASALVWRQGLAEWTEAERVPEIVALLPPPLPPGKSAIAAPLEPPPIPPAAPVAPAVATAAPPAPAANPKIEELRQRLEKDPNPRLYGQLADELRKAGDFAGAIRVCRDGFERGASYPSLRLTLGRSLLESGELQAARTELEALLQMAPDNILGERFLGECLEALGDRAGARTQFLKALALAPGDPQLVARLRALHGTGEAPGGGPGNGLASPSPDPGAAAALVSDEHGLETSLQGTADAAASAVIDDPLAGMLDDTAVPHASPAHEAHAIHAVLEPPPPPPPAPDPAPIPLVAVEESFEIERATDIAAGTTPARRGPSAKKKGSDERGGKGGPGGALSRPAPPPTPVFTDFPADLPTEPPPLPPLGAPAEAVRADAEMIFEERAVDVTEVPLAPPPVPKPAAPVAPAPAPPASSAPAAAPPTPGKSRSRPTPAAISTPGTPAEVISAPVAVPEAQIGWPTGRLADHEFADLIREVYSRQWSGLLTLNHMGVEKSVRVQDGRLVFAFSSARDDRLGELLLRRGRISLQQYVEASRAMRKGIRLGTVLVEQGALDARELVKVVMDHTQEIIFSAFQWTEGLYHFTEGAAAAEPISLKLSTPDVILEGVRRIDSWSRIEHAIGSVETRYCRTREYEKVLGEMTLSLEKLSILTGLDTEQDVGTICRNSTLSHFEVCRTLWAYRVIGVVQRLV